MIKHYFKAAVRRLIKQKLYTVINIFSLAIGLALCFIVIGHVSHEFSFEDFHQNKDRIYRAETDYRSVDTFYTTVQVMSPLGGAMVEQIPEVEKAAVFRVSDLTKLTVNNMAYRIDDPYKNQGYTHHKRIFFVEPDYFKVFSFPLISGNPEVLAEPFRVFISENIVDKYFRGVNPIGETIVLNDNIECQISGILKTMPQNTQLLTDFVVSYSTLERIGEDIHSWTDLGTDFVYLLLKEGADPNLVETKIPALLSQNMPPEQAKKCSFYLKPLSKIYFKGYSGTRGELDPCGEASMIYEILMIAVFVLLLAITNFINLATARSADRSKDVGVRKVFGAGRWHLIKQYLGESLIMTFLATLLSLIIYEIFKLLIKQSLPRQMFDDFYTSPIMVFSFFVIIVFIGILAGFYPAIYLSRFKPIAVLQRQAGIKSSRSVLRKVLVVFQFTIAIMFVFCTVTIIRQVNFLTSIELGYDRENIMLMDFNGEDASDYCTLLKREILKHNKVLAATATNSPPGRSSYSFYGFYPNEERKHEDMLVFKLFEVDYDFLNTFGLEMKRGRAFSEDFVPDAHNPVIVNEAIVKKLGVDDPIGYRLYASGDNFYEIVGIVEDFHGTALDFAYQYLMMLRLNREGYNTLAVKLPPENINASIAAIRETWQ
ncbi:MAG: ABC transporter permease, partial [candidate division Zixibacteria bacterium]|nr:ABC transporter permease [candidate division Zixibacteria bacterium]